MKSFVIVTDSCGDINKSLREKYDVDYVPMHYTYGERDLVASLDWEELSAPDFYNVMRGGTRIITSQANVATYEEAFERYLAEGLDILSISCSSALSASVKASYTARDVLLAKYPERKIYCIDSLMSCGGLAILCIMASRMREAGKSIDEVAEWVTENRLNVNQEATVEKLLYLKQAGRVSAASAFFGGILNIKPIIISDVCGRNVSIEKVKGRALSFKRIADRFAEEYVPSDAPIFISHADCLADAEALKAEVLARLGDTAPEIVVDYIGPIVGASVGPGTVGVWFFGKKVTFDAEAAE